MSLGLVSDDEFESELSVGTQKESHKSDKLAIVSQLTPPGRSVGDNNVPDSLRKIIGDTHLINGRDEAIKLADEFGISKSSVSAYAKGSTSTSSYNQPKSDILSYINKSRERAIKRASKTLNVALESITQDKLDYADARDLSGIAKDMSVIIKNLEPDSVTNDNSSVKSPQFVIFAPTFRKEESFDVINVIDAAE